MKRIVSFIRNKIRALKSDSAEIVSTVIIVSGFAITSLALVNWLSTAILNKAADSAECIEGSNTYTSSESAERCKKANHAEKNSFKNDAAYKSRFGNG